VGDIVAEPTLPFPRGRGHQCELARIPAVGRFSRGGRLGLRSLLPVCIFMRLGTFYWSGRCRSLFYFGQV